MAHQIISTSLVITKEVNPGSSHWGTTEEEILSVVPTTAFVDSKNEFTNAVKRMIEDLYGPGHPDVKLVRAHVDGGGRLQVTCTMTPPFENGGSWCKYLEERFTLKEAI